jgi:hypothetical protein
MTSPRRRITAGLLLAGLGACHRFVPPRDLKAPELRITAIEFDGLQRAQARMTLTLDAYNPNAIELPLSEVQFEIQLFAQPIGRGWVDTPQVLLPAHSRQALPVELSINGTEFARALRRGLGSRLGGGPADAPDWTIRGTLRWGQNPVPLPFNQSGRLGESRP